MESKEIIKFFAICFLYGAAAPGLGVLLKYRPHWQRWVFALICFMTIGGILRASEWGLTLDPINYRGHARGYHFFFAEVLALGLLIGRALTSWKEFRIFPPGMLLYLVYCAASMISIFNAPEPAYVLMAGLKAVKIIVIFAAAYNFIRSENDIRFFLSCMSATMIWELVAVLKMKYLDGIYQVPGTFEHQNALSMFSTMIGMVLLAAAMGPKTPANKWYLFGFLACAIIQECSLSRAGLAAFAAATAGVALLCLLDKFTLRRLGLVGVIGLIGLAGIAMTLDTIISRFNDYGTEASGLTRKHLNEASRHMFEDYPLGIGWNNFALVINKPYPYGNIIDNYERSAGVRVDETHKKGVVESLYYLLLSETGLQSLMIFLMFIALFLWRNLRAAIAFRGQFLGAISIGILMGCAANYAQSTLERVLTQPRNLMLWMILLALTARIHVWRKQAAKERRWAKTASQPRAESRVWTDEPVATP